MAAPYPSSGSTHWTETCQQLLDDIRTLQTGQQRSVSFQALREILIRHPFYSDQHFQKRLTHRDWRWISAQCRGLGQQKTNDLILQTAFGGNFAAGELRASALQIVLCKEIASVLDTWMNEEPAMG